eukprot:2510609-Rhodomonas_salina.1
MSPFIEVCINSPFMFWTCKTRRSRHKSVPHAPQLTRQVHTRQSVWAGGEGVREEGRGDKGRGRGEARPGSNTQRRGRNGGRSGRWRRREGGRLNLAHVPVGQ